MIARLGHFLLWLLVSVLVLLAVSVTTLRILLPHINYFQGEITHWVNQQTNINFSVSKVDGFWRNTHPSISLQGVKANLPDSSKIHFNIQKLDVEFDLVKSLLQHQLVVAKLDIHHSDLDISSVDLLALNQAQSDEQLSARQSEQQQILRHLDNIFLRQLGEFTLKDSSIRYKSFAGETHQLVIDHLKWQNQDRDHRVEGVISVANTGFNSLGVKARFKDYDSFKDLSGHFYVSAEKVNVGAWFTKYLQDRVGIKNGTVSFNAWLTLKHNKATDGYVKINPSQISFSQPEPHQLSVHSGVIKLVPLEQGGVKLIGQNIAVQTDHYHWPDVNFASSWHHGQFKLNLRQLELQSVLPLLSATLPQSKNRQILMDLNPQGTLDDIRVSYSKTMGLAYSANLSDGAIEQWALLPEVHKLHAHIEGNEQQALIKADLVNDTLPYGDVFQAPLHIRQGHVNLVWQKAADGWSLWSDHVAVDTPELRTLGAFKLDFKQGQSPFLSFYLEANLSKAGETWRYLPTLALGTGLTNYLSSAIQGGQVHTAKLLWYGPVFDFPYTHHNGVFQADVPLQHGKFSFDTAWPALDKLNIDLLFQNDSLVFQSDSAESMGVQARRIVGNIAHLTGNGHLAIKAHVGGEGGDVRHYMMATPLVGSVGAALTTLKVRGQVDSEFQLDIPFNFQHQPRAWGWADLRNNQVTMPSLSMNLSAVTGRIYFDDDVLKASGISGTLLNQTVSLGFHGESKLHHYHVHIDTVGNWQVKPLGQYVGTQWVAPLTGNAPWNLGVDVQLNDVGFTYQVNLKTDLKRVKSDYPAPLNKAKNRPMTALLQASGNQETISARVQLPKAKYQAEIDISQGRPILTATNLVLGNGSFKVSPIVGNDASVRLDNFNLDHWLDFFYRMTDDAHQTHSATASSASTSNAITVPFPDHIAIQAKELHVASLDWHDVDVLGKKKATHWNLTFSGQEIQGTGTYNDPQRNLSVALSKLHLYIPGLDDSKAKDATMFGSLKKQPVKVTELDKSLYHRLPNIKLAIQDFWLQGYKVGALNAEMQTTPQAMVFKHIDVASGSNKIHVTGSWVLHGEDSHTQFHTHITGKNNTDVMERFGISSGIQKAPFDITSQLAWNGAPWSIQVNSLSGHIATKFGKGFVSDVSGAAKLLGVFSLDSIIRKMQLDFSDVFDKGMAFDSITGSGDISKGVLVTNNLKMDALAGDMSIKGLVNLNSRKIDAEVQFVPDMTSGLPVLSAFAVNPVTALYVLAITTVISPVVEVFTEVNYEVKGPIDAPTVKEISRSKGEFKLPESFRNQVQSQENPTQK